MRTSTPRAPRRPRDGQRGAAMMVVLIVTTSLLIAGSLAVRMSASESKSTSYLSSSRRALYCAEAGLAATRATLGSGYTSWNGWLDGTNTTGYPLQGYIDHTQTAGPFDWQVTIRDNDDEIATNVPTQDSDQTVFVLSTCLAYPETPRTVGELVSFTGGGLSYRNQSGQGASNTGNNN
jgi:hypothetical protein